MAPNSQSPAPPPEAPGIFGSKDLEGKVCIVTGGSRGIGREIALHLAARGGEIVINYASRKDAAEGVENEAKTNGGLVHAVQADLTKPEDVKRLFDTAEEKSKKLSILVNNAGAMDSTYAKVADTSEEAIEKIFELNIKGAFLALQEAARRMEDGGRIVNISSSLVAFTNPGYGVAAYSGSKAALENFTKCLAPELRGRRITVNCVAPGPVATELFFQGKTEAQIEKARMMNPLERLGRPEDIANVVGFLVSREGEWINAQIIRVNGGFV